MPCVYGCYIHREPIKSIAVTEEVLKMKEESAGSKTYTLRSILLFPN